MFDIGSVFGGIGNFLGGLFGQKKKDPTQPQVQAQPQPQVQRPQQTVGIAPMPGLNIPSAQSQQAPTIQPQQLSGVTVAPTAPVAPTPPKPYVNPINTNFNIPIPGAQPSPISTSLAMPKPLTTTNPGILADQKAAGKFGTDLLTSPVTTAQSFGSQLAAQNEYANQLKRLTDTGGITSKDYIDQAPNSLVSQSGFPIVGQPTKVLSPEADAYVKSQVKAATGVDYNYGELLNSGIGTLANVVPGLGGAKAVETGAKVAGEDVIKAVASNSERAAAEKIITRDPSSPITMSPPTEKPAAITSPNPNHPTNAPAIAPPEAIAPPVQVAAQPPVIQKQVLQAPPPQQVAAPIEQLPAPVQAPIAPPPRANVSIPQIVHDRSLESAKPSVTGNNSAVYNTADPNLNRIMKSALVGDKGTAKTAGAHMSTLTDAGFTPTDVKAIRNFVVENADKKTGSVDSQQLGAFVNSRLNPAVADVAPTEVASVLPKPEPSIAPPAPTAPVGKLGTIMRDAAKNGELTNDAGSAAAAQRADASYNQSATDAGSSVEQINQKLHDWNAHNSNPSEKKWTTAQQAGLTPEETAVAQAHQQEMSFVRNRVDPSLRTGGLQGPSYTPRQGKGQEFTQALINENERTGSGTANGAIDTSSQPFQDYLHRYANAPTALSDKVSNIIERGANGAKETGVTVSKETKAALGEQAQKVVDHNDNATRLADAGDKKGADAEKKAASKEADNLVNMAADSIPKDVTNRSAIISDLTEIKKPYTQSFSRTIQQSSIPNRLRDLVQATSRKVEQRVIAPATRAVADKVLGVLNPDKSFVPLSKADALAARQNAAGTLSNTLSNDFNSTIRLAGAGKTGIAKGAAKAVMAVRGTGTAVTSAAGDISTQVKELANRFALQSKPVGIEPNQWLREQEGSPLMQYSQKQAERQLNPYVNLPGGDRESTPVSNFLSKEGDNLVSTNVQRAADRAGIELSPGVKTFVKEINDTVTPRLFGYAGATARAGSVIKDNLTLGLLHAHQILKEGAPGAEAAATEAVSRSLIDVGGTAAGIAAIGGLANAGLVGINGPYPSDPNEKSRWHDEGLQPDSIYVKLPGGKYASIGITQIAQAGNAGIGIATAIMGAGKDVGRGVSDAVSQMINNAGGGALISDAANISAATDGANPTAQAAAQEKLATSLVPGTGIIGNIANATDPNKHIAKTPLQALEVNVPGLRQNVPLDRDSAGNVISNSKQVSGGSSLLTVGDSAPAFKNASDSSTSDPVKAEVDRFAALGIEITPTKSAKNSKNSNIPALSQTLLNDPIYKSLDDTGKSEALKTVLDGSATKDINTSISPTGQQALLDYKVLGAKAQPWLDDNKNNANYQTAVYDNKVANGAADARDKSLQVKGSLHYNAVAAQVDQTVNATSDMKDNYKNISQAEFRAMLSPDNKAYDPTLASSIYAYDKARADAGVSENASGKTNVQKYNLDVTALKNKGSGGTGAPKSFTFANLPTSLISSSGSGGAGPIADGAPLFKPIASLQAPTAVAIPKGRTISVTKV